MNSTFGHRTGVAIMALLGLIGVIGLAGIGQDGAPPASLAIVGAVLGAMTLLAALPKYNRTAGGICTMIGTQTITALTGIPVFWTDEAPGWASPAVVASWVVTLLAVVLLVPALRTQSTPQVVGSSR